MRIIRERVETKNRHIKVKMHTLYLYQLETVLQYLGHSWDEVHIRKDNISYDDLDELKKHHPVKMSYLNLTCYGSATN